METHRSELPMVKQHLEFVFFFFVLNQSKTKTKTQYVSQTKHTSVGKFNHSSQFETYALLHASTKCTSY